MLLFLSAVSLPLCASSSFKFSRHIGGEIGAAQYRSTGLMDVFPSQLKANLILREPGTWEPVMDLSFNMRYLSTNPGATFTLAEGTSNAVRRCLSLLPGGMHLWAREFTIGRDKYANIDISFLDEDLTMHHMQDLQTSQDPRGRGDQVLCKLFETRHEEPTWGIVSYPARFLHGDYHHYTRDGGLQFELAIRLAHGFITVYYNDLRKHATRYELTESFMKSPYSLRGLQEGMHVLSVDPIKLQKFERDINAVPGSMELFHDPWNQVGPAAVLRFRQIETDRRTQRQTERFVQFAAGHSSELPQRLRQPPPVTRPMQFGKFKRSEGFEYRGLIHELEVTVYENGILIEDLVHPSYENSANRHPAVADIKAFVSYSHTPGYDVSSQLHYLHLNPREVQSKIYAPLGVKEGPMHVWVNVTDTVKPELILQFGNGWPYMPLRVNGQDGRPIVAPRDVEQRNWLPKSPVPDGTYGFISNKEAMCVSINGGEIGVSFANNSPGGISEERVSGTFQVRGGGKDKKDTSARLYDDRYVFGVKGGEVNPEMSQWLGEMSQWRAFGGNVDLLGYIDSGKWVMNALGRYGNFIRMAQYSTTPTYCYASVWFEQLAKIQAEMRGAVEYKFTQYQWPVDKESVRSVLWKAPCALMREYAKGKPGFDGKPAFEPFKEVPLWCTDFEGNKYR